jgi:hypothetical protein
LTFYQLADKFIDEQFKKVIDNLFIENDTTLVLHHQIFNSCAMMSHLMKKNDKTDKEKYHSFSPKKKRNEGEANFFIFFK